MKNNSIRGYLTVLIFLIVFSALAFIPPFTKTAVFYVSYCFGIVAILAQIYFFRYSFSKEESIKSKFYGFPIARIGVAYLIVQIVISLIEMVLASVMPLWIALLIDILIICVALIGCIAADTMRDEIIRQETATKKETSTMHELESLANIIEGQCNDEMKITLHKISEEIKYSDPISSNETVKAENELFMLLKEIQKAVVETDVESVRKLSSMFLTNLTERNRICKLNKN